MRGKLRIWHVYVYKTSSFKNVTNCSAQCGTIVNLTWTFLLRDSTSNKISYIAASNKKEKNRRSVEPVMLPVHHRYRNTEHVQSRFQMACVD